MDNGKRLFLSRINNVNHPTSIIQRQSSNANHPTSTLVLCSMILTILAYLWLGAAPYIIPDVVSVLYPRIMEAPPNWHRDVEYLFLFVAYLPVALYLYDLNRVNNHPA
jgi:hypothetical protein